jgi:hypothetical protein
MSHALGRRLGAVWMLRLHARVGAVATARAADPAVMPEAIVRAILARPWDLATRRRSR